MGRGQPTVLPDSPLVDVRQYGVGAAESEQCRLGEEPAHLRQGVLPAVAADEHAHRHQPQQSANQCDLDQLRPAEDCVCRCRGIVVNESPTEGFIRLAMPAASLELVRRNASAEVTDSCGSRDNGRERHVEREDGDKRCSSDGPQHIVLQGTGADAMGGLDDNSRHCGLDAVEQARNQRHITESDIYPGQGDQDEQRGQHKQGPGDNPAPGPVHQPADIGGQLLGFRSW